MLVIVKAFCTTLYTTVKIKTCINRNVMKIYHCKLYRIWYDIGKCVDKELTYLTKMQWPLKILQLQSTKPHLPGCKDTFCFLSLKLSLKELVVSILPYKWKKLPHLKHLGKFGPSATMKLCSTRWEPSCEVLFRRRSMVTYYFIQTQTTFIY